MTQPLAIVFYEKLLPGSQLVNRLHDLNYRVQAINDPAALLASIQREMPMLLLADLTSRADITKVIADLQANEATAHIPVIAFAEEKATDLLAAAQKAGAALAVSDVALNSYLPQLLNQALHID
jgi:CheY-like chemotaxis protein